MRRLLPVPLLLAGLLVAPQAEAQLSSSARCFRGDPPDEVQTVYLNKDNLYTNTAYFPDRIWPGDTFKIFADGLVDDGGWPSSSKWTPDGKAEPTDSNYPAPRERKYSLLRKLAPTAGYAFAGSQTSCSTSTAAAGRTHLKLIMNDHNLGDNNGSWKVTVQLWWA